LQLALTQAKWSKKQNWKGQKCPQGCTRVKWKKNTNILDLDLEKLNYIPMRNNHHPNRAKYNGLLPHVCGSWLLLLMRLCACVGWSMGDQGKEEV